MICTRLELIEAVSTYTEELDDKFFKASKEYETWWRNIWWSFVGKPTRYELSKIVLDFDDYLVKEDLSFEMNWLLLSQDSKSRFIDISDLLIKYPKLKDYIE